MSGYHILGGIPPFQVLQQQNAGIPPGGVPPWYAMQYPAGYVPPLLVSVDNPLEPDPIDVFDEIQFRGERDRRDLARSGLQPGWNAPTYIGTYDLNAATQQMNTLKPVHVSVARALLKGGQSAINQANQIAHGGTFSRDLPGQGARDKVYWGLDWHQKELAKRTDPTAIYEPGEDLKKFVLQAFIETNASEEGRTWQNAAWDQMWTEIGQAIADLPAKVAAIPGEVVKKVTGIPLWAWGLGALTLIGLVGFATYKILLAAAPVAAPALINRYLPAGPR